MNGPTRDVLLGKWAVAAVRDVLETLGASDAVNEIAVKSNAAGMVIVHAQMTRLLRQVYAQGQRDAIEAMHAAVVVIGQCPPAPPKRERPEGLQRKPDLGPHPMRVKR